jgi:protein TonB
MSAVRFPLALVFGLLFTLTVFTVLFRFVDTPFSPPTATNIDERVFVPLRPTPPPSHVRAKKIEPPKLIPTPGRGTGIEIVDPPHFVDPPQHAVPPGPVRIDTVRGEMPTGGIDREPIPLVRMDPDYPARAIATETEGWVQVQFTITNKGTVKDARVVAAEPRGIFEEAALNAITRWRYNPKIEGAVAVERVGLQTVIRFQLGK